MSLTALAFLLAYVGGLLLAVGRHPIFGLFTYLLVFYNHPPARWWGAELPDLRWSLIASLVTLVATLVRPPSSRRPPWYTSPAGLLLGAYAVWMWIQSEWAIDRASHLEGCILFTKYVVLFILIYEIASTQETFELFSWGHVAGCFILGWVAFRTDVSGRYDDFGGPGVGDANTLGMHLATGLAFAGFMYLGLPGRSRWGAFGAIPFIMNGIVLTASRGAALAAAAGGVVAPVVGPRAYRRRIVGTLALGTLLLLILSHKLFWDRVNSILEYETEGSALSRIELIKGGLQMFRDHPWGAGHMGHDALSHLYLDPELLSEGRRSAHNTFMAVLVDQGIPGAVLWLALQAWAIVVIRRLARLDAHGLSPVLGAYRAAIAVSLTCVLVSGLTGNYLKAEVHIWLLAALAALQNVARESLRAAAPTAVAAPPAPPQIAVAARS